ncbi:MAG: hypothetical protein QXO51_06995 [Halobacteria archaeon]
MAVSTADLKQMFSTVRRMKNEVDSLYEELEILLDRGLSGRVREGLEQAKRRELHSMDEFRRALKE